MKTNVFTDIYIEPKELDKIWWYVDKCDKEISGLGKVIKTPNGLVINKIYLIKQECTAVETELDAEAVADLLYESRNDEGEMLFWWHSHVNMGVNWSETDYKCMRQLGGSGMIISTVFNKKRQTRTSVYVAEHEHRPSMFIDEVKLQVTPAINAEDVAQMEKEYKEKVSFPKPVTTMMGSAGYYGSAMGKYQQRVVTDKAPSGKNNSGGKTSGKAATHGNKKKKNFQKGVWERDAKKVISTEGVSKYEIEQLQRFIGMSEANKLLWGKAYTEYWAGFKSVHPTDLKQWDDWDYYEVTDFCIEWFDGSIEKLKEAITEEANK